ncbi:hypothetical protein LQ567_24320 [Niabella pedocola]|uniref:Translation elongation factor EFTu/EF1A C-terminal domain-containing protein n=1 Tax=Niabella pedocola TaxID=1752077 RepID=A0ABS8Q171_9BACT|nr:hypothetical protein [Niabella pedocola]MCD2425931.1 hypothetical protein [Niabella pedocola]
MKEITLTCEIVFLEIAEKYFNFPITNSIRSSFWIADDKVSTFSQIKIPDNNIVLGRTEVVEMTLIERDFLMNRIKSGTEFRMGVFPREIALGRVIKVQSR